MDVGFDHGRRLTATATATANPEWTVIGLEVRQRRVDAVRAWAERESLANLHAFRLDARAIFANAIDPACIDVVEVLFPTPWPSGRARRRLLVTPDFLTDAARVLRPGGLLHVATDVPWYAAEIRAAFAAQRDLRLTEAATALAARPTCAQQSRREWTCARDGLTVYRFTALRRAVDG